MDGGRLAYPRRCATSGPSSAHVTTLATAEEMTNEEVDEGRRELLVRAVVGIGSLGIALAAVPFVRSWLPSERARSVGGPVTVDPSKIEPGQMIVVTWRRKPIYIVHRTSGMLALLGNHARDLKDPQSIYSDQPAYADNALRSRRADLFVTIGICTHLGCLPKAHFQAGDPQLGVNWPGGFLCPCHGSRFDLAGRVFKGSPASVNLVIPPHEFDGVHKLVLGVDSSDSAA